MGVESKMGSGIKYDGPIRLPVLLIDGSKEEFRMKYTETESQRFYIIEKGTINKNDALVRMHSACNIAHIFGSLRCDCKEQLEMAKLNISKEGNGLLVYCLDHEGRGVGPKDHVRVYVMQDLGFDTVD